MKKLPIGIQTFSEIIDGGYYYVDKTPLISSMVTAGKYYFLSRPRRFGKSLLVSTLKAAFSGQKELFSGLYLETHWDWGISYPVVSLSFGRGVVQSRPELDQRIDALLGENAARHGIELKNPSLPDRFSELIQALHRQSGQRVVILVDEYDKPILDNIDKPEAALEIREGLKNIYSVIKDSDADIKFAFLTGVSKFSKVSLFSGLNNLTDITLDRRYATLCGYTEEEIAAVFVDYREAIDYERLREGYNGYNFLGEKVYNPYDVLLYLDTGLFRNYWFETGSPSFLIKLVRSRRYAVPNLESIEAGDALLSSFDVDHIELETLLFQTGYLTIKGTKQQGVRMIYRLGYPNREVKMSLTESLLNHFVGRPMERERNLSAVYEALNSGDVEALAKIFHAFFASIPYDWYRKNQLSGYEGYYASIFYCYFCALGLEVVAEECSNKGRLDLAVRLEDKVYIIEFKVLGEKTAKGDALQQIKAKGYAEKYRKAGRSIYLLGVEFNKEDRNIEGFEWEVFAV
jgi:Predicted AAA-ATPase/PD-(D/E)XK nuclease superfamily